MVGLVGSSNNPVSGMTIATLLVTAFIIKSISGSTASGMIATIAIGSVICIISAMAGDTSQDLKTGYILGATPMQTANWQNDWCKCFSYNYRWRIVTS